MWLSAGPLKIVSLGLTMYLPHLPALPAFQLSLSIGHTVPAANCDYAAVPTKIVCTVPAASSVVRGDVVVTNPDLQSGALVNGFTFTGVVDDANFCNV